MACHVHVEVLRKQDDKEGVCLQLYPRGRTIHGSCQVESSAGGRRGLTEVNITLFNAEEVDSDMNCVSMICL